MALSEEVAWVIGREGTPQETAGVVAFLASLAADYLVGVIIEVNGGQLMS
jgi:NAD(P)-dependent dehydrogenase (short-subunit alcohol dehydrogenase family)